MSQASSQNEVNVELATVSSDILIEEVVKSSVEVGVMADIEQAVTSIVVQNTEKVAETIEAQKTAVEPIKTPELVLSVDSVEPGKVDAIQEDNVVTKIESGKSELKDKLLVVQAVPAVILSGAQEVSNEQIVLSEIQNQQVSSQVNIPEPPVIEKIVVSSIIEESDSHSVATEISSVDKKTNVVSNSLSSESLSSSSGSISQVAVDVTELDALNSNNELSVVSKNPAAVVELPTSSFNYGSISEKNLYNSYISSSLALSDSIMKVSYADSLSQSLYKIIFSNFLLMLSLLIERIRRCSRIENRYYV